MERFWQKKRFHITGIWFIFSPCGRTKLYVARTWPSLMDRLRSSGIFITSAVTWVKHQNVTSGWMKKLCLFVRWNECFAIKHYWLDRQPRDKINKSSHVTHWVFFKMTWNYLKWPLIALGQMAVKPGSSLIKVVMTWARFKFRYDYR